MKTLKDRLQEIPNLIRTIGAISLSKKPGMKYSIIHKDILDATSYMELETKFDVRIWSIINDLNDYARCTCGCGTILPHPFKRDYIKGHAAKCPHVKNLISQKNRANREASEKRKQTNIQRYGVEHTLCKGTKIREALEEANIKRYGSISPFGNKDVQKKSANTLLENFGVDNPMRSPEVIRKLEETMLAKYGVKNYSETQEFKDSVIERNRKRMLRNIFEGSRLGNYTPLFAAYDYVNCNTLYKFKCNMCSYEFENSLDDGQIPRCPVCYPSQFGKMQKELVEVIKTFYSGHVIENDRSLISPLELDIVIPELKIAIEFNGTYWHSDAFKDSEYHLRKTELCEAKGWQLIHVFEHEWQNKKRIVIARLKAIMGMVRRRIYARKCEIREIDTVTKNAFLKKYHLQGDDNSSIALGLFYKNRIVALMTFAKPRFDKSNDFELVRYVTISSFTIVGGAGKLFKHFRNANPGKSIVTYADRRWSKGEMYSKLGFTHSHDSTPNYFYVKGTDIKSRYQCQKHLLENWLSGFDAEFSETENMKKAGWIKTWDCGNKVFVFHK